MKALILKDIGNRYLQARQRWLVGQYFAHAIAVRTLLISMDFNTTPQWIDDPYAYRTDFNPMLRLGFNFGRSVIRRNNFDRQIRRALKIAPSGMTTQSISSDKRNIRRANGIRISRNHEAGLRRVDPSQAILANMRSQQIGNLVSNKSMLGPGWCHLNNLPIDQFAPANVAHRQQLFGCN